MLSAKERCARLEGEKPAALIAYLGSGDRKTLDQDCIMFSIEKLGTKNNLIAVKVLAQYLDFCEPAPAQFNDHYLKVFSDYPATISLFNIGAPALAELIAVIADAQSSELVSTNALLVIRAIKAESHPEAVALVVRAGRDRSRTDAFAGYRLQQAAEKIADMCLQRDKADCAAALHQ